MTNLAITGATGVAGGAAARALAAAGHRVVGLSRSAGDRPGMEMRHVPDLADVAALRSAVAGCDMILHFADRADRKGYAPADLGTAAAVMRALREAARQAGIARIVVASSVHAEHGDDLYARSKRAMEAVALADEPGAPALVLRLPPLHGAGARGMVRHVARAARRGWPLPFARAMAPRRFLSLEKLGGLCAVLATLPPPRFASAAGRIWYPADAGEASLAALARSLGGAHARLLPVPGIDRLLRGTVPPGTLAQDRAALLAATGWCADE